MAGFLSRMPLKMAAWLGTCSRRPSAKPRRMRSSSSSARWPRPEPRVATGCRNFSCIHSNRKAGVVASGWNGHSRISSKQPAQQAILSATRIHPQPVRAWRTRRKVILAQLALMQRALKETRTDRPISCRTAKGPAWLEVFCIARGRRAQRHGREPRAGARAIAPASSIELHCRTVKVPPPARPARRTSSCGKPSRRGCSPQPDSPPARINTDEYQIRTPCFIRVLLCSFVANVLSRLRSENPRRARFLPRPGRACAAAEVR